MQKASLSILTAGLFFSSVCAGAVNPCDLNLDGFVNGTEVQLLINMSLGLAVCNANIAGPNVCNVNVVQRVINAAMGGSCFTSSGIHSVSLTWTPSVSPGITGYQVLRSTTSGGSYSLIASPGLTTSYTDNSVQSGVTYYYVVTAVANNQVSPNSNQAQAIVPVP